MECITEYWYLLKNYNFYEISNFLIESYPVHWYSLKISNFHENKEKH